jgi:hypothetical protein
MEKSATTSLSAEGATGSSEIVMRGNPLAFVAISLAASGPGHHTSGRKPNGDEGGEEDTGRRGEERSLT